MAQHTTIQKHPQLAPVEDFWALRREGQQLIEKLAHGQWTDYNIHDPGITLLEALCYALTDLGYRTAYPVEDLLAPPPGSGYTPDRQGFFTARRILTNAPWTVDDYRKLLIDLPGIRNAWLFPKDCPCGGLFLYASCKDEALQYTPTEHPVIIRGLWDVLVEFEDEDGVGDLNSGWQRYAFSFGTPDGFARGSIELRLPVWSEAEVADADFQKFRKAKGVQGVEVLFISGNKYNNVNIPQEALAKALRKPLFATLKVTFTGEDDSTETVVLEDLPMHVRTEHSADGKALQLSDIAAALADGEESGLVPKYLERLRRADEVMRAVRATLDTRRNLCEDWCSLTTVPVEDIAVCADLDVAPDADIEAVLAEAYAQIGEYFSPEISFHSLDALMERGVATEEIFNGPALQHGFLLTDEVRATGLKKVLQASDVINLLMDIPGVEAVRNFSFGRYNRDGEHTESVSWTLAVAHQHQPRLYIAGSKFLVYKAGLPFLPNPLELADTLQVVRAGRKAALYPAGFNDLPVPAGTYIVPPEYEPVMNTLPRTYGVGPAGLPASASALRKAQAAQLRGYLLHFEQMLANYLADLGAAHNLFALDEGVEHSYASHLLTNALIEDLEQLYALPAGELALDADVLQALTEDAPTFLDRRNRFLDAMLARFAESFSDYALVLHDRAQDGNAESRPRAQEVLIKDKISFLKELPETVARRGQAFNAKLQPKPCVVGNEAGLQNRLELLLGFRSSREAFELYEEKDTDGITYERRWRMKTRTGQILLSSSTRYVDESLEEAHEKAAAEITQVLRYITEPARYVIKKTKAKTAKWAFSLTDETGEIIATRKQGFSTEAAAAAAVEAIIAFAKTGLLAERMFIIEHLLLRPHNRPGEISLSGDPLLPICVGANCELCGEEDPYSFRMTVVLNGETGLANEGMNARRFAERTIRQEVPAHLGVKICWVSLEQLLQFEGAWCAWLAEGAKPEPDAVLVQQRLTGLLEIFTTLRNVYPPATLHDCIDGNDDDRAFLNHTYLAPPRASEA